MLGFPTAAPAQPWVYQILMILNNISNSLSGMSTEVKSLSVRVAKLENSKDNFSKDTVENVKTVNSKIEDLKCENEEIKIENQKLFATITDL